MTTEVEQYKENDPAEAGPLEIARGKFPEGSIAVFRKGPELSYAKGSIPPTGLRKGDKWIDGHGSQWVTLASSVE